MPAVLMSVLFLLFTATGYGADEGMLRREDVSFTPRGDPSLQLAGEVLWLDRDDFPARRPGVVICHPDPRMGGTKSNPVVQELAVRCAGVGLVALCFDFRSAGGSGGRFDGGRGEVNDVLGAIDLLRRHERVDPDRIVVAGYSFGAFMGLQAMTREDNVRGFFGLAFPLPPNELNLSPYRFVRSVRVPMYFISGSEDPYSGPDNIRRLLKLTGMQATVSVISGADHFFRTPAHMDSLQAMAMGYILEIVKEKRAPAE